MTITYTPESILSSLGYADPLDAARQQARMILLGRLARYEAHIRALEAQWECTLADMNVRYTAPGQEKAAADDAYLDWQWYADAKATVQKQLAALE